jgi:hypothetical protein
VLRGAGPPTERQVLLRFAFFLVTIVVASLLLLYLTWTGSQTLGPFLVRMGLVAWVFYAIWQTNRSRSEVMAALDRLVKDAGRKRD